MSDGDDLFGGEDPSEQLNWANITVDNLPDAHWDCLNVLIDVVVHALQHPDDKRDDLYAVLRRDFMRDTGMSDIVPDFVIDCSDLSAVCRYLARTDRSLEAQVEHIHEAFRELVDYMELVFRPRAISYIPAKDPWPGAPKTTTFAPVGELQYDPPPDTVSASDWTGRPSLDEQARRVLALGPLALAGLDRLVREADAGRRDNRPPQLLLDEVDVLHRLHRELGVLIRMARAGQPVAEQLGVVRKLVASTFRIARDTGQLMVSGLTPLAASALPAWGTLKICETILGLGPEPSATLAAGVIAGSYALRTPTDNSRAEAVPPTVGPDGPPPTQGIGTG